jgi:hypothetical protein
MLRWVNRHRAAFTIVAALISLLQIIKTNTNSFIVKKDATVEENPRTRGMLLSGLDDVGRLKDDGGSNVFENATTILHMNPDETVVAANLSSGDIEQRHSTTSAPVLTMPEAIRPPWAALCAVVRDNDLYMNEWTDYHLALGFEHIFIYDSDPNFSLFEWYTKRVEQEGDSVPDNMSTANRVHLTPRVLPDTGWVQALVYGECLDKLRALDDPPKWVMVLDGDEFLVFRDMDKYPNVVTFLTDQLHSGSLQINWVVMGSANETAYRDEPVTKRFQFALSGSDNPETKTVAILEHVTGWRVHDAKHKPGYSGIGMGGREVGIGGDPCFVKDGDVSVAAIFHYKYKSFEEFNHRQCVRGDIYKAIKHACPATVVPGDVFDDSAWRAMTRLVPKYASLPGRRDGEVLAAR